MTPLVFAVQFEGHAVPVDGSPDKLRARTFAYGQTLRTSLTLDAIESAGESAQGASATFESEVEITGQGRFVETGSISYGTAGSIKSRTVGFGVRGPRGIEGVQRGAVIRELTGGEGQFAGIAGLITSNLPSAPREDGVPTRAFMSPTLDRSPRTVGDQVAAVFGKLGV